ncbi:EscU/YscU/HrcU family type III secretion system export apparatus switch protein, partial [Salmonella enterica]|uniref:EscU/YscU/HrcU family type III secretion system export apparatus switch protein n=1 Tax=Salmonella enterica TaxID=28901 RepID=UPI0034D2B9DD
LYRHDEIGQQIPGHLYAAVAEVLAWVWQIIRWRLAGGHRPPQPENLPVPEALYFMNEKNTDGYSGRDAAPTQQPEIDA